MTLRALAWLTIVCFLAVSCTPLGVALTGEGSTLTTWCRAVDVAQQIAGPTWPAFAAGGAVLARFAVRRRKIMRKAGLLAAALRQEAVRFRGIRADARKRARSAKDPAWEELSRDAQRAALLLEQAAERIAIAEEVERRSRVK